LFGRLFAKAIRYALKKGWPVRDNEADYYFGTPKKETAKDRAVLHRQVMPWLYSGTYKGTPRDSDVMEFRRLSMAPIVQLCIGTRQEEVKKTPWAIIKADRNEKRLISSTLNTKLDRAWLEKKKKELSGKRQYKKVYHTIQGPDGRKRKVKVRKPLNLEALADEAAELLSNPNTQGQTFADLTNMIVADMAEVGDACLTLQFYEDEVEEVLDKADNAIKLRIPEGVRPAQIQAVDVLQFNKDEDMYGTLKGFWNVPWIGSGYAAEQKYFTLGEILWFTNDPRSNRRYGFGDIEKCRDTVDISLLSQEQESSYFSEGMVSPGCLSLDDESGGSVEEQTDYYREHIKGHPEKIWILNKKANWVPFTFNYRDLQFLERKLWDSKVIAGTFKLNLQVLGMQTEGSNRATAFADKLIAYEKGVAPQLKAIEHIINTQLIWKYYSKDLMFVFDPVYDPETKERVHATARQDYNDGVITLNEARREGGYDKVDEGDEFKQAPAPVSPFGSFEETPEEPEPTQEEEPEEEPPEEEGIPGKEPTEEKLQQKEQIRVRQFPPEKCSGKGYTIDLKGGVSAYICPVGGKDKKQSILFDKDKGWTREKALSYCKEHGYETYTSRETGKAIIDRDAELEIPVNTAHPIYAGVQKAYYEVIQKVLTEVRKHRADFEQMSATQEGVEQKEKRMQLKAVSRSVIEAWLSEIFKKTALTESIVGIIVGNTSKNMLQTIKGESSALQLPFDQPKEVEAIQRLTQRRMSYYKDIPDTLSDTVIQTLVDGIDQGRSYQEITDQLKVLRDDFSRHRAETIARTEIGRSRKEAQQIFAEEYADVLVKRWRATSPSVSQGGRTRESHWAMDGKTVGVNDSFLVDYSLDNPKYPSSYPVKYPGESKYDINCRCSMELVKKKA
jgi:hypothetical protein